MATTPVASPRSPVARLREEVALDDLPVSGTLPSWLTGTLLRLSVADFEAGGHRAAHLFDGLAMLHKFAVADGRVSYANRFLDTAARRARLEGRIGFREFASDPCRSLFRRVAAMFSSDFTDNANVNLIRLGREFLAMTETPLPVAFDPRTLETAGVSDALPPGPGTGAHVTAHPHLDRGAGAVVSYATLLGPRSRYQVYATRPRSRGGPRAEKVASMAVRRPSYMHSFGLTDRHVVLAENPLVVNPLELALSGRPFIENFRWEPERGTRFHVFERAGGARVGTWQADPFFCFHHVNAFEEGSRLVVDLVAHDDASVIDNLYLDRLDGGSQELPQARLRRFRLDLRDRGLEDEPLCDERFELPRIDYGRRNGRRYRYVYGTGFLPARAGAPAPPLVKVDVEEAAVTRWVEDGCLPGEPVFVAAPEGRDEDDGVVLSVVTDAQRDRSFLLVLDASTFEERARAEAPHAAPLSFHGNWFAAPNRDRRHIASGAPAS
jgi:beta,beta-carotene 9',10'-dioxygenase